MTLPWAIPFAGLLLSIAVLPLAAHHWWENNRNRAIVAAAWALPVLGLLLAKWKDGGGVALGHAGAEYMSFIALLGSLYVVSGGILVTGDIRATPRNNTLLLAVGALLSNLIGTTGASMLLIRPLLRMNSERHRTLHVVVFFIFIVSNCGGCLTPIGDPPLYLGYLRGVPFAWTLEVLWKEWLFVVGALLAVFYAWDTIQYRREAPRDRTADDVHVEPFRIAGGANFLLLGGVIACVLLLQGWMQAAGMAAMAGLSLGITAKGLRERNGFSWGPIAEVAILFAGIFVAMVPALQMLEVRGSELGLREPWQYFAATGILSSFLDNAPTYLTFFSTALGAHDPVASGAATVTLGPPNAGVVFPEDLLAAISLGAVFMGAMTYIGNGPNFMVKSIAESAGQRMPSFFGYMLWSGAILGPLMVLTVLLFLV
ncbi:MAG: sodium:proton antiporter [Planctomycetaceae bacterium]|nr:sodium:proton antiporter [Planctomycetaceae bacterium]